MTQYLSTWPPEVGPGRPDKGLSFSGKGGLAEALGPHGIEPPASAPEQRADSRNDVVDRKFFSIALKHARHNGLGQCTDWAA